MLRTSTRARRFDASLVLMVVGALGCHASRPAAAPGSDVELIDGGRAAFDFTTVDGRPLSTESVAGRVTVIGFGATYDIPSQAEARFLSIIARSRTPRVNVALLMLEPAENLPLVEAYAKTLQLPYPVALADAATIAGRGPFSGLHHVPSVVVLDSGGRERWRHLGLVSDKDIERVITAIERVSQRPGEAD